MSTIPASSDHLALALRQAQALLEAGEVLRAELIYLELLKQFPAQPVVLRQLGSLALARGDDARALSFLGPLQRSSPGDLRMALQISALLWRIDDPLAAVSVVETALRLAERNDEEAPKAWLALGQMRQAAGDVSGAGRAFFQALQRARARGWWLDAASTPAAIVPLVEKAESESAAARRLHLLESYDSLRSEFGNAELQRVDRALRGFLKETDATPADPRQRPKFLYFPDLPSEPYLDPLLVPWAGQARAAFDAIRTEAMALQETGEQLPGFVELSPGDRIDNYLGGAATRPAWDAFFFYRHGQRYDANHERCPRTSELLESVELFRVPGQAPEVCFSFLAPRTVIKAHYGVSNTRLVMHLPLVVPPGCALNLIGVGEHVWREGELMLFDDTYQHEAWNHSDQPRIVLLMDCWNPRLTAVERLALSRLIVASSEFEQALKSG